MVLRECLGNQHKQINLQLFGADIDKFAVDKAREGIFPASIAADVSPERLRGFFLKEGEFFRMSTDCGSEYLESLKRAELSRVGESVELCLSRKYDPPVWVRADILRRRSEDEEAVKWRLSLVDITEKKQAENLLKDSLSENQILLRELHHRVKNNMQMVCSILRLQSNKFSDPVVINALEESFNRVLTLSLVHENLYKSDSFTQIDLASYIGDLVNSLGSVYNSSELQVAVKMDVEKIRIKLEQAVHCGLILNELVINAFKHAFSET